MAPKLIRTASASTRILPNVEGPAAGCRCLYVGILWSLVLYVGPLWVDLFNRNNRTLLRRCQRVLAVRSMKGYRAVSWTATDTKRCSPICTDSKGTLMSLTSVISGRSETPQGRRWQSLAPKMSRKFEVSCSTLGNGRSDPPNIFYKNEGPRRLE